MPEELISDLNNEIVKLDQDLKGLEPNDKKRGQIISLVNSRLTATFKSHIGPLPSPEALKQYNDLLPGTAERIISMAERQSAHRIELEKKVISRQLGDSRLGQFFGFFIAIMCILASYSLGMNGHEMLGGVIGGSTILSLVTIFVIGKKKQNQNLQAKT